MSTPRSPEPELELDIEVVEDPPARAPRPPRVYRLRDAAWLLAAFAATLLLLDADGLHAWVTRMDVGPAQDFWASLVEPWRQVAARARLTEPRRLAVRAADRLAAALGGDAGSEDLLARGWTPDAQDPGAASPEPAAATPPDAPAAVAVAVAADPGSGHAPAKEPRAPGAPAAGAQQPAATAPGPSPAAPPATAPPPTAAVRPPARPPADTAATPVLLIGDSLMVTLAPSLTRAFEGHPTVKLILADRSATGLSRPEIYDWPSVAASFVATHRPRLVICAFGGNDAQDVRKGKAVLRFGTADWDDLYAERVRTMMALLKGDGAEVLWLGLPPMRMRTFDGRMRHLNELYLQEATALGVTFEPTGPLVGDRSGRYAEFLRGRRGKLVRVRSADGIHYADDGARLVALRVRAWVDERLDSGTLGVAEPVPGAP
jgi:hypothetical protein